DRVAALTFEITALRGDLGGTKPGKKRGAKTSVSPVIVGDNGVSSVSPDLLLTTLHADAEKMQSETGDAIAILLTAFAQSPDMDGDSGEAVSAVAQTTVLRLVPDAARDSVRRDEQESSLCERAARIAASFGATPRILIARLLLTDGTLTATQLGTGANLTTGSLYHHLREMTHAGVLDVVSRNRYALTPLGRRSLLSLLAFAQDAP
ncbi:MAG: helix-turn-helix transcriptional regulator, partial [Armatimonadetes bacterium]|nr:helix-turn-helix transcriptional regulator [Armatimonadota bacterium]